MKQIFEALSEYSVEELLTIRRALNDNLNNYEPKDPFEHERQMMMMERAGWNDQQKIEAIAYIDLYLKERRRQDKDTGDKIWR